MALAGGMPGARVMGPLIAAALTIVLIVGLRGAARWRPGLAWTSVLADAGPAALSDWTGSTMLVAAMAVMGLVAAEVPTFVLVLPGLLLMAAVAVERRAAA